MKKVFSIMLVFALVAGTINSAMAQNGDKEKAKNNAVKVEKFEAGKTLGESEIGFLHAIASDGKARGAEDKSWAKVGEKTYKAGMKLSADDAKELNKEVATWRGKNKPEKDGNHRGAGDCYYYCYYDYYGNYVCYWYCD
ncbi:MAG: hypothetical protein U0V74_10010 [Chitinophagales bacterium]